MTYQPGEIIDITIRGARVLHFSDGDLVYEYDDGKRADREEVHLCDAVTIARRIPAAGMPKPGELWQDAQGDRWLAVEYEGETRLSMGNMPVAVAVVQTQCGPIQPVYRDDPGTEEIAPTIARHVLWHYGLPEGVAADAVIRSLILLIRQADAEQRDRLARGYGGYVAAVNWAEADGGIEDLRQIARRTR